MHKLLSAALLITATLFMGACSNEHTLAEDEWQNVLVQMNSGYGGMDEDIKAKLKDAYLTCFNANAKPLSAGATEIVRAGYAVNKAAAESEVNSRSRSPELSKMAEDYERLVNAAEGTGDGAELIAFMRMKRGCLEAATQTIF